MVLNPLSCFQRDTAKAKSAYQDFLTLWKDADPDIPILKEAKAEYAKLRQLVVGYRMQTGNRLGVLSVIAIFRQRSVD